MANINVRQLIDLAIGSPDPGHVNFYALHCLLYAFADKLKIIDERVDYTKFGNDKLILNSIFRATQSATVLHHRSESRNVFGVKREMGGADPEEGEATEQAADGAADAAGAEAAAGADTETVEAAAAGPGEALGEVDGAPEQTTAHMEASHPPSAIPSAAQDVAAALPPQSSHAGTPTMHPSVPVSKEQSLHQQSDGFVGAQSLERIGQNVPDAAIKANVAFSEMNFKQGIAVMKFQLELAMDQLMRLTYMKLHPKTDEHREQQLRKIARKLHSIQHANVFIESTKLLSIDEELLFNWESSDAILEEGAEEAEELTVDGTSRRSIDASLPPPPVDHAADDDYNMDLHLCYTPEKLLDQLLALKTETCILTNKVNDLTATLMEQDSQRTALVLQELQEKVREQALHGYMLKEEIGQFDLKLVNALNVINTINRRMQDLMYEKIDKSDVAVLLADKVDFTQLQRKVAKEQLQELQCRTEKQFCELQKIVNLGERNMQLAIDNVRQSAGINAIESALKGITDKVNQDIQTLYDFVKKNMMDTDDECVAAGARIKMLQDLACLSCDTTCVMRTIEKSKVGKLPNAKASNMLSPLITYELGSIRKSGIMGYYRKDEFPHAPHAWMQRNISSMKACVPRHAGGPHTTHTAKEHVQKVLLNKK